MLHGKNFHCGPNYAVNLKIVKVNWDNIITCFIILINWKSHYFCVKILFWTTKFRLFKKRKPANLLLTEHPNFLLIFNFCTLKLKGGWCHASFWSFCWVAAKLHPRDWIYIAGPAVLVLILAVTCCSHYEASGDKYPLLKDWETAI